MPAALKLEGKRFNSLFVNFKEPDKKDNKGQPLWNCTCDCGITTYLPSYSINAGTTKSCGCLRNVKGRGALSQEEFLQKAKERHGDKYDYSKSVYVDSSYKINITCPKHGDFMQRASDHLNNGAGCKECRKEFLSELLRDTKEDFIIKARKIHGDKFKYDNVVYVNRSIHVDITCKVHGDFSQLPSVHLNGNGCKYCRGYDRSTEQFVEAANRIHGNKYDYSEVNYVNSNTKVSITCGAHGTFKQAPTTHLQGVGCKYCGTDRVRDLLADSLEQFLEKVKEVHVHSDFDYSKVKYKNRQSKIEVVCRTHGSFFPQAGNFLAGSGCPACSRTGYSTTLPGVFYVLRAGDVVKVGITNKTAESRAESVSRCSRYDFAVARSDYFKDGKVCSDLETTILRYLRTKYSNPKIKFPGSSECFLSVDIKDLYKVIDEAMLEVV